MTDREEFEEIFTANIHREGSEALLKWIQESDFFQAPASTKFHSAFEGGLVRHSINAYKRFLSLVKLEYGEDYNSVLSDESIALCGLLHDICKANYYKVEQRNVKEDGVWVQRPYYTVSDSLPYGHGEKSVYIINGFLRLTREEAMIINWHMGGFDSRVVGGSYAIADAFKLYPNAVLFHLADLEATYLDEK